MVGLADMGLRAAYIGKTGRDKTGEALAKGFREVGLDFATRPTDSGSASARSMIAVTPDGERTMNTFLGASVEFETADVRDEMIRAADTLYLEGYLFDADPAKAAFIHAAEVARASGGKVAITLSDPFCVERHRESFRHLVDHHVAQLVVEGVCVVLAREVLVEGGLRHVESARERIDGEVAVHPSI